MHYLVVIIALLCIAAPWVIRGIIVTAVWTFLPAVGLPASRGVAILADAIRTECRTVLKHIIHVHGGPISTNAVSHWFIGGGTPWHATFFAAKASYQSWLGITYALALDERK